MKTLMVTIAAAMMALNAAAYNPGSDPNNYCVKNIGGQMVVELNGIPITEDIEFKDGICIKPNGIVVLASGQKVKLNEGECVNETGVMSLLKLRRPGLGDQSDFGIGQKSMNPESDMNKTDSTKTDETLDPDRFKNDQSNPDKNKNSGEELPPKK